MKSWPLTIRESFFLVVAVLLQWILIPYFAISRTVPDLLLIFLILRSLHLEKPGLAVSLAFSAGLALDWLSGGVLGLSSLILSIAAFTAALIGRENEKLTKTHLFILGVTVIPFSLLIKNGLSLNGLGWHQVVFSGFLPSLIYNLGVYLFIIYFFSFKKKRKMI